VLVEFDDRWLARATWAFVALGVLLRVARYAMNFPLWWDEAFVAVNFIKRGYLDLLQPLDYGQVCPVLFLWAELSFVKMLGFSEWSLRLFPLGCAVVSVVLFCHVARRVAGGLSVLLAVAIFATSFHPILHAADVKPYASDLLAALVLLAIAIEWGRAPERTKWLWILAATAPLAIAVSHPAVFIAGGIAAGLAPKVLRLKRRVLIIPFIAVCLSAVGTFALLYFAFTRAQSSANLGPMQSQWSGAFPPLESPYALAKWLAIVHTGSMFAYPCGGEMGASSLTLFLFVAGALAFWRRGERFLVLVGLAPFVVAFAAAALKRYPYGGPVPHGSPARVMQFVAPIICLMAGNGAAALIGFWRARSGYVRRLGVVLGLLVAVGVIPLLADAIHPYRSFHAYRARQFARDFWPSFGAGAEPLCLRWDLAIGEWNSTNLNVAVYLCNQMIYAPRRQRTTPRLAETEAVAKPLRYVAPLMPAFDRRVTAWAQQMTTQFSKVDCQTFKVNMAEPGARPRIEEYTVYEFRPKPDERRSSEAVQREIATIATRSDSLSAKAAQ
jgi:hypothetical protein